MGKERRKPNLYLQGMHGNAGAVMLKAQSIAEENNINFDRIIENVQNKNYDGMLSELANYFNIRFMKHKKNKN